MQVFYGNISSKGESGVSPSERNEMKNATVDYGALHHSPVQEQASIARRDEVSVFMTYKAVT